MNTFPSGSSIRACHRPWPALSIRSLAIDAAGTNTEIRRIMES